MNRNIDDRYKLDLLERFHQPIYLGQEYKEAYVTGGPLTAASAESASREIVSVYERVFKQATGIARQAKILQSFVSNFPILAWRQAEWFWSLWMKMRSEQSQDSKPLLRAIARGVAAPEKALAKFHRQLRIERARRLLRELKHPRLMRGDDLKSSLQNIQGAFREDRDDKLSRRAIEESERANIEGYLLELECPLKAATVLKKLKRRGIAETLLMVAAATHDVRERDLARRSLLQE